MQLIYGADEAVCDFVAAAFGHVNRFDNCIGLAVDRNGELVAGVVIELKTAFDAYVTVFSTSPKVWTRRIVSEIFGYLFGHLGVARITCETDKKTDFHERLSRDWDFATRVPRNGASTGTAMPLFTA